MQYSSSSSTTDPSLPSVNYVTVPFGETLSRVGFIDVGCREGPVVVALHGAPGGVQDFAELYSPLTENGIRILAPEFPGYGHTTVDDAAAFDESTEARATLVHNLLTTLCIKSVTAVIGHSMGSATAFHLAANYDNFQSVIYLNGLGFVPQRTISPYWLTCLYARLLENSWTEPVLRNLLSFAYRIRGYNPSAIGSGMNIGVIAVSRLGFDKFRANASRVREKNLPVLFSFTQNDRLIEWKLPMEVVRHLGTPDENLSLVDSDERVVKGPKLENMPASFPWAVIFERGGHFVHRSHQAIISQCIVNFVKCLGSKPEPLV